MSDSDDSSDESLKSETEIKKTNSETEDESSSSEEEFQKPSRPIGKRMPANYGKSQPESKKSKAASQFFIEEAEADEDDSEEDEDAYDEDNDIIDAQDERKQAEQEQSHRKLDAQQRETRNQDDMEKYFMDKYVNEDDDDDDDDEASRSRNHFIQPGAGVRTMTEANASAERANPTVKDPSIWLVKCRIGEEKQTVRHVIRKAVKVSMAGNPLQIKSVISPDAVKGYIYVEAWKENHVISAIEDIATLYRE